jgi:hypothetical protein
MVGRGSVASLVREARDVWDNKVILLDGSMFTPREGRRVIGISKVIWKTRVLGGWFPLMGSKPRLAVKVTFFEQAGKVEALMMFPLEGNKQLMQS